MMMAEISQCFADYNRMNKSISDGLKYPHLPNECALSPLNCGDRS
jgi:hypothetical protein